VRVSRKPWRLSLKEFGILQTIRLGHAQSFSRDQISVLHDAGALISLGFLSFSPEKAGIIPFPTTKPLTWFSPSSRAPDHV